MDTAEKLKTCAIECACGRFYETMTGVTLCEENGHGRAHDKFDDRHKFANEIETRITVMCDVCTQPIRSRLRLCGSGNIEVNVLPHVCQIEPEES